MPINLSDNVVAILVLIAVIVVSLLILGVVVSRLYRRASKELAFVRTGLFGQRVVMSGGTLVLPIFHETIGVNMNTLRLEVKRSNEAGLITKDRMRVDVQAEFFVRVKPTEDAIADAAQTLGKRTMEPSSLKELVEGKFVDALRAVAAELTMEELHEKRVEFVQRVQTTVSEDILKNGLELESVSLTALDQTSQEYLNPQNAFDAQGLAKLTEIIEAKRKQRNDIEQETRVQIQQKNLDAEQRSLSIAKDQEYARLEQEREVSIRKAAQSAEIAREQAARTQESRQAEIDSKRQIDQAQILAERKLQEERIATERAVKELELEKEKAVETSELAKKKAIEVAELEKRKALELAEQERAIAIAEKSREKSEAEALAAQALAQAVQAEEAVITVREKEIAERKKTIELVQASELAERDAIRITVAASAEKKASEDRAAATRTLAEAEAAKVKIEASGDAEAERVRAEAAATRYTVDAEGKRALNEAENLLSPAVIEAQIKRVLIQTLPEIIRESVKPMEKIDGIKIVQVSGLGGSNATSTSGSASGETSLADQIVNSALKYRTQAPLLDSIMKEVGLSGSDTAGLTQALMPNGTAPAAIEASADKSSDD
jgi:uncharacterized membrane protein YqiK